MRFFEHEIDSPLTEEDIEDMATLSEVDVEEDLHLEVGPAYRSWHDLQEEELPTPDRMGYINEEDEEVKELNFE
jgi:hypothetical protein